MIVVDDIVTSFSDRRASHKSAWPRMQACLLGSYLQDDVELAFSDADKVFDADAWYVSHAMEFNGKAYNLFGGWNEKVRARVARLLDYDPARVYSLEYAIPDLESILRPRSSKTDLDFTDDEWAKIRQFQECEVVTHNELAGTSTVVLGDSHSISRFAKSRLVLRQDGMTLHGLNKRGIQHYLDVAQVDSCEHLIVYAGNIDIRHHLCRQADPHSAAKKLVHDLASQLNELSESGVVGSFQVTALLPIEFEGRKTPKSSWYKNQPFFGSREERNEVRMTLAAEMNDVFGDVFEWPREWYAMDPEEFAKLRMEKPQSIHLSPEFYEWDIFANQPRIDEQCLPEPSDEQCLPEPSAPNKSSSTIVPTDYFDDFIDYFAKAAALQELNISSPVGRTPTPDDMHVDDPLMHFITIYDCVERRFAGFSNALQQVWFGSKNPKRWQANDRFDGIHSRYDEVDWLWLFLIHRVTGSGASFSYDHGFRNSIIADMAMSTDDYREMRLFTLEKMLSGTPVFTSIGNQIPPFPKPRVVNGISMKGSQVYVSEYMSDLVLAFHSFLSSQPSQITVSDGVDWVCDWHTEHYLKQFRFVLTAWVMDVAEYMPQYIDPYSRVHYGANCIEALDLLFENNGMKKRDFYDEAMDIICSMCPSPMSSDDQALGFGRPYSLEDVCCDYIRYVECYVPKGYEHLEPWMIENRSKMKDHPRHHTYHKHLKENRSDLVLFV